MNEENAGLNVVDDNKYPNFDTRKKAIVTAYTLLFFIILIVVGTLVLAQNKKTNRTAFDEITPQTTSQNAEFSSSTKGSIELPWTTDNVNTFHNTYYLFGSVVTDGDLFHVEVSKDGKLVSGYTLKVNNNSLVAQTDSIGSGFVTDKSDPHKNFYYPIPDLSEGNNSITVKLYTDESKAKLLDAKSFNITKATANLSANVSLSNDGRTRQIGLKEIFDQLGVNFDKEKIWEYSKTARRENISSSEFLYGKTEDGLDYSLELIGEIDIDNSKASLYKFFYMYPCEGPCVHNNAFYFYVVDKKAYFITNSLVSDNVLDDYVTPMYLFYMNPSPYIFEDTVAELDEIKIDYNNMLIPASLTTGDFDYCNPAKLPGNQLYKYQSYTLYDDHKIYDKYGNCQEYRLVPSYFKSDKYIDASGRYNPDFNKMSVSMDSGQNIDGFYSPYWVWCAGTTGYRVLSNVDAKYLEPVGKTSSGEMVYIYSKDMPFPMNPHLLPSDPNDQNGQLAKEDWQKFLDNQKDTYPVLVIKNIFGEWVVYINANSFLHPGC